MARDNVHVFDSVKAFFDFVVERESYAAGETYQLCAYYGGRNRRFDVELRKTGQQGSWRPFTIKLTFERATELYEGWKKNKHDCPIGVRTLPGILKLLHVTEDAKRDAATLRAERERLAAIATDRNVRTYLAPFARQTAADLAQRLSKLSPESRATLGQPLLSVIEHLTAVAVLTEGTL